MREFERVIPSYKDLVKLMTSKKFDQYFELPVKEISFFEYQYCGTGSYIDITYDNGLTGKQEWVDSSVYEKDNPLLFRAIMMDFVCHGAIPGMDIDTDTLELTLNDMLINQISIDYRHRMLDVSVRVD